MNLAIVSCLDTIIIPNAIGKTVYIIGTPKNLTLNWTESIGICGNFTYTLIVSPPTSSICLKNNSYIVLNSTDYYDLTGYNLTVIGSIKYNMNLNYSFIV
jgi:hypothetical protein